MSGRGSVDPGHCACAGFLRFLLRLPFLGHLIEPLHSPHPLVTLYSDSLEAGKTRRVTFLRPSGPHTAETACSRW